MSKLFVVLLIAQCLMASSSLAQMGHGMMREMPGGMMHEHMMGHEQMIGNMLDMMNEMSGLMDKMSEIMKDMPKEKMHQMSYLMRDMCSEMSRLSEMMDRGTATDEEIKDEHDRIIELQKQMSEIGK